MEKKAPLKLPRPVLVVPAAYLAATMILFSLHYVLGRLAVLSPASSIAGGILAVLNLPGSFATEPFGPGEPWKFISLAGANIVFYALVGTVAELAMIKSKPFRKEPVVPRLKQ